MIFPKIFKYLFFYSINIVIFGYMKNINLKDALGNEIIIGQDYGFTNDANGILTLSYGTAVKISEGGKVTLKRFFMERVVYNNGINTPYLNTKNIGGIKPLKLFPIDRKTIKYKL